MMVKDDTAPPFAASPQLSRLQIMEATSRCLSEEGYDATTIRRIAARLRCAVGSIYRYFADKRDLLDAVAQSALEPAAALVDAGGSVEDSARLYHELAGRDAALYRMLFWLAAVRAAPPVAVKPPATDPLLAHARQPAHLPARPAPPRVIARIIDGWSRRLGDPATARLCWTTLHGCIMLGSDAPAAVHAIRAVLRPMAPATPRDPAHAADQSNGRGDSPAIIIKSTTPRRSKPAPAVEAEPVEDVVLL